MDPFTVKLDLGHVHIKVSDLQRSLKFYEELGFKVGRIPMGKGEYVSIGSTEET